MNELTQIRLECLKLAQAMMTGAPAVDVIELASGLWEWLFAEATSRVLDGK